MITVITDRRGAIAFTGTAEQDACRATPDGAATRAIDDPFNDPEVWRRVGLVIAKAARPPARSP